MEVWGSDVEPKRPGDYLHDGPAHSHDRRAHSNAAKKIQVPADPKVFRAISGSGIYTLQLRHALSPRLAT